MRSPRPRPPRGGVRGTRSRAIPAMVGAALFLTGCGDGAGETSGGGAPASGALEPTEQTEPAGPVRRPVRSGTFYPADAVDLRREVRGHIDAAEKVDLPGRLLAVTAPHAGYVYSGPAAGWAYRQLAGLDVDTVVLVGGHGRALPYGAVMTSGAYLSPLGEARVDRSLALRMVEAQGPLRDDYQAHAAADHALEVHVPFVQVALPKARIVPVCFNREDLALAARVGRAIAEAVRGKKAVIVCSTDLSHYPPAAVAEKSDRALLEAIASLDCARILEEGGTDGELVRRYRSKNEQCAACCLGSVLATVEAAKRLGAVGARVLKYDHSGNHAYKDRSRVVGYGVVAIYGGDGGEKMAADTDRMLTDEERKDLLALARKSVETKFEGKGIPRPGRMTPALEMKTGAFVTLHEGGKLRGCIGTFGRSQPLWQVVGEFARNAAFQDSRFPPVSEEEVGQIEFEISVLSPLKDIENPIDIRLGIDGIWLVGSRGERGTFLPQVATETGWSKEQFLSYCAAHKAGMEPDAWRDPERCTVQTYTAEVFSEGEH